MILFLDFDGVLHTHNVYLKKCDQAEIDALTENERRFLTKYNQLVSGENLFEHADRLASILEQYPDIEIVISSTWRSHFTLDQLSSFLPPSLGKRVIGQTPQFLHTDRNREIYSFKREKGTRWFAIDDALIWGTDDNISPNLFRCDSAVGLDEAAGIALAKFLVKITK